MTLLVPPGEYPPTVTVLGLSGNPVTLQVPPGEHHHPDLFAGKGPQLQVCVGHLDDEQLTALTILAGWLAVCRGGWVGTLQLPPQPCLGCRAGWGGDPAAATTALSRVWEGAKGLG